MTLIVKLVLLNMVLSNTFIVMFEPVVANVLLNNVVLLTTSLFTAQFLGSRIRTWLVFVSRISMPLNSVTTVP